MLGDAERDFEHVWGDEPVEGHAIQKIELTARPALPGTSQAFTRHLHCLCGAAVRPDGLTLFVPQRDYQGLHIRPIPSVWTVL